MKKLLADYLNFNEENIENFSVYMEKSLSIETERDFGSSYPVITGEIYEPQYVVKTKLQENYSVNLSDLLVFLYNKTT